MWRDQGAIEKSLQYLLACAAFDVFGEPIDSTLSVMDGMGQHGVLGAGQCHGAHLMLLLRGC